MGIESLRFVCDLISGVLRQIGFVFRSIRGVLRRIGFVFRWIGGVFHCFIGVGIARWRRLGLT